MPVSGDEEPGVLPRKSSHSLSVVPLKKRWQSMVQFPLPIRPLRSFSNENLSKTKDSGLSQRSNLNSCDSTGKSDTPKNSLLEVKEERPSGAKVDPQPTMLPLLSISPETNSNTSCGPPKNVDNLVKPALAEELAGQEAIGTTTVTFKKEVIANSGNAELSLGAKEPHVSSLVDLNNEGSCLMRGTINPSLLSVSLNKGKDISEDGSCKNGLNSSATDDTACPNRSHWDLNTPMDSWEGSGIDASVQDACHISSASVIGANGDKGKQVVGASELESNFPISSIHPTQRYKSADVLRLSLGSTSPGFDSSVLQPSSKVDYSGVSQDSSLLMNSSTCETIRSEPIEETLVHANAGKLEANTVKTEVVKQSLQSIELSTKDPQKLVEQKPMKCEPLQEVSQEISMTSDVIAHQSVGRVLQLQESSSSSCSSSSSTLPVPLTPLQGCPSKLSICSDLSVSGGDLSTPSEYSVHTNEANRSKDALHQANADTAAKNVNFNLKESNVSSDKVEASVSEGMNIEDHMVYEKLQEPHNLVASGEGSANDEEKISISAGTEDCYGSDYESDGDHAFGGLGDTESVGCVREDEEYEEGEVREPLMQSIAEDPIAQGMGSEKNSESSSKSAHSSGFSGVGESYCLNNDGKDYHIPVHSETTYDFVKGYDEKADKTDHKDSNLQNLLLYKEETTGDVQDGCAKDVLCDGAPAGSSGARRNVGEDNSENIGRSDMSPTAASSLQNAETYVNAYSSKDSSNFGSKSRIINLPRASSVTSPSNSRHFTSRSLSSRSGRERYADMENEKFNLRRNREETYSDGPKFGRDRIQDWSFVSSRGNFMRGRGRGSGRFNSLRREWDTGRGFNSYGGGADYRFRRKRAAAVGESEIEHNNYDSRLDGAAFASNRRKPLNDALPSFRHPSARRLSPNGREDAAMMGIQMLRRVPRNISPSRCAGEDGSEYVGLRHSDKFIRDFPADNSEPVYSHQQPMYDGPDGHFVQGNTKFTAMQRRGFPRMRSKSPVKSRTRSLGPWSSPRKRLMEGFNGHQDSSQHRSSVMYREDRMRSSARTSLTEEAIAPRRRDSPSYTARHLNDTRDMDVVQEQGQPRSLSSRRSPPDRVFTRSNRRFESLDRRERAAGNEYFDGPIHTGRFPELCSGGSADERRKYGERRGGGLRQMRNVDEQEGKFRQSEQLWHEEEFDVSSLKRRRY